MGYAWERFKIYFKLCSLFVSIILNFNAIIEAYIVQKHYTVLLKNNTIFDLILEIFFGN